MKKIILSLAMLMVVVSVFVADGEAKRVKASVSTKEERSITTLIDYSPVDTIGYKFSSYKITQISGDYVFGVAIDNISKNNRGIVLEVNEETSLLSEGEEITVMFESFNDIVGIVH